MTGVGRSEPFADGFPHDLSVSNPGVAVIQCGNSREVPKKCTEGPLHTYCRHPSLAPANGRFVPSLCENYFVI